MTALERLIIELKKKPGYGITEQSVNISGYNIKQLIDALEALPAGTTGLSVDGSVTGGTVQTQEFTNGIQVPTISSSSDIIVGAPAGEVRIATGTGFTANTTGGNITLDATGDIEAIASGGIDLQINGVINVESINADINLIADTSIDLDCASLTMNSNTGFTGTVTTASLVGKTITITNGIITGFA